MFNSYNYKTGIFYSQRIVEKNYNVAAIENKILERLNEYNIDIVKKFSDLGYLNLQRPGLNELITYLINLESNIDVVAFYSFDFLGRDKRRISFVMPRIKRYAKEVIFIENKILPHSNGINKDFIDNKIAWKLIN
ncbi:recombinase family protein [Oceanobacillus chungangensis]|uniref:Resolvase/invertase-type recombinase catalytic domain-containing protein n=1 Tax=Oceanobacillus chungangensis TaxID=1229152 RepID=A0A3D8PWY5_9BACI|nr:recombinase family protein [Oceanobacillus chungangensis]RDW19659.1 hypothetical protein CWR45_06140 [Oceanobacillus chungangensis]